MAIQWKDNLATGIDKIDEQHKELFNRTNQLLDACNTGKGKEEVAKLLDFLEEYVVKHFKDEEQIQLKHKYPDYNNHKILHDKFIAEVRGLRDKLNKDGSTLSLIIDINKKVIDWLVNHIGKVDKELAKYIKEQ